jgi:hypothetical protein
MPADDALLFIDANIFLDLYRTTNGKKALEPLAEQSKYIFVTRQVVEEVQRNKLAAIAEFLVNNLKKLKLQTFQVPDHLFGTGGGRNDAIRSQMSELLKQIEQVNREVGELALEIMQQVSRSTDEVSRALAPIFANAAAPSPEELKHARERKEFGRPPGKQRDALGDQISWEQILTMLRGKSRLWIISRDEDFGQDYGDQAFVNCLLQEEVRKVKSGAEVYLFRNIPDGIDDFVRLTGVPAKKRLSPQDAKELKKEEHALPRMLSMGNLVFFTEMPRQPIVASPQPVIPSLSISPIPPATPSSESSKPPPNPKRGEKGK